MNLTDNDTLIHPSAPFNVQVDPEHGWLRLTVLGSFIVIAVIGYMVVESFVPQAGGINILGVIGGLGGAAVIVQGIDRALKAKWPSGRIFELDGNIARLTLRGVTQREADLGGAANLVLWRFPITKRARAPKGWYVVAIAFQQDDLFLPVYTFMSPDRFSQLEDNEAFSLLTSMKQPADMRLAGHERRLRNAESARWYEGAEMLEDDFTRLFATLKARFPDRLPKV